MTNSRELLLNSLNDHSVHQRGGTKMKIRIMALAFAGALALSSIAGAFADAPANPGCFGRDRAAYATANGSLGHEIGGVGYYASLRAGDNGAINQAYKTGCGGDPTPGAP